MAVCTAITYIFHVVDSIAANALLDWYSGAYSQSYSNTRRYQSIGVTEAGLEVYTYTLYNAILRIARNFLETREIIKILTHPFYHINLD